jgi:hypothetical protein
MMLQKKYDINIQGQSDILQWSEAFQSPLKV